MFVVASAGDQCLLPVSVASVGLSAHTSMQTVPVEATKGSICDTLVKGILQGRPCGRGTSRGNQAWREHFAEVPDKKAAEMQDR